MQYLRGFSGFGGKKAIPAGSGSLERFARTAMLMAQPAAGRSPVDRAFELLTNIAQPGSTRWSIAYDATNREVTWTSDVTPARKSLRMASVDFFCNSSIVALDIRSTLSGDVGARFTRFSAADNLAQMLDAYSTTAMLGEVSRSWIEQSAAHAQAFACVPQQRLRAVRK